MIPSEFSGMARELQQDLLESEAIAKRKIVRLTTPFSAVSKGTVPRQALLSRTATAWPVKIPEMGRLKLEIDLKPASLYIRELRMYYSETRIYYWDACGDITEPGIVLTLLQFQVVPKLFRFDIVTLAGIG
jgi:hypothetical protein